MHLTQFTARNFRNLAALDAELPADGVVIIGENGHGKTNLLEAIYYLVLFRSLRGAKDRELVRFGEDGFFVAGAAGKRVTAGYEVAGRRKKVTVDRTEVKRLSDGVGLITAVGFSPADRAIVAGGPAGRRRYLDILLCLSAPGYLGKLAEMRNALRQRNAALRQGRADEAQAFDDPFAEAAVHVTRARRQWAESWAPRYQELCGALGEQGTPEMRYHPRHHAAGDDPEDQRRALRSVLERDLRRGMTTVGPHRDDLDLSLTGRDLRAYGSAGQQRTAAIALRLLEAETVTQARGSAPIALYDDVFAELDGGRQANLLALIRETLPGQAIVTAPRESEVPAALLDRPRWRMSGGRLER
ncbi:MAG: DNA replication and repair protein RecF [Gemmatimonadales bacterium]|nr:DNA replication and repair protein RecF [Gemmatimonadales bacterium]NIN48696.1 DNA replication and repair protein RecF [Gemmatimonadales bacterium]NIP06160.1 DNA replication and repair protein RecF [Gemmatimonadales bacterium]NIR01334.1 DNA replication and repair protein RecF [Gemmatimonadales bacterium]